MNFDIRKRPGMQGTTLAVCVLLTLQCGSPTAKAQPVLRWQEVEVLVFTHEDFRTQVSERPLADAAALQWLPRPTLLQEASAALAFPFETLATTPAGAFGPDDTAAPLIPLPAFGPQPALMNSRSFRLLDAARDPFVALDPAKGLLDQDARRLTSTGGHRVLWHAVWRQPLQPAAGSQSLLVQGGDPYGSRHELEGSIRVSDSGGRAQLDLHLWFSQFMAGAVTDDNGWSLPALPAVLSEAMDQPAALPPADTGAVDMAPLSSAITLQPQWSSNGAWQLRDTRLLTEDAYHYLDNPAIGVLVQIRPYAVPPRELGAAADDF